MERDRDSIVIKKTKQNILTGSSKLSDSVEQVPDRVTFMIENMHRNKAYLNKEKNNINESKLLLEEFKNKYSEYRRLWSDQIKECHSKDLHQEKLIKNGYIPLCIDIEVASICDLACPFCYRETIATPDKIINDKLFYRIVDQAVEMGVPSLKLNWRGEPLMHPKLPEMIRYAKNNGILEVIINTNATHLTEKYSKKLIDSGLDMMIYSFDGGTKETYERMRPGRFKDNSFDNVYNNIINFSKIRKSLGAVFPRTKIQMIMTNETYKEQNSFFKLFNDYVDEVTVTQYSERGGNVADLNAKELEKYKDLCEKLNLPNDTRYLRDSEGNISVSSYRLACEQPYQRMLITYDGRVSMCCYDWGAMHPIGYVSNDCFADEDSDKRLVIDRMNKQRKGFELLQDIKMPLKFNHPGKIVQTLAEIWEGQEIGVVRKAHACGKVDEVEICKKCPFKDTYHWVAN